MLAALLGYICGSIPFGLLLARMGGKGDVREIGSGNIGATNVLRTGSKALAAGTLLLDLAKGLVPVLAVAMVWDGPSGEALTTAPVFGAEGPEAYAAVGAVLGHCFPVWLKFKGGKGVATNAGVSFGLAWPIGLAYAAVWLAVLAIFRISSLAGMSAVVAAALTSLLFTGLTPYFPFLAAIAALIIYLHRGNITRLIKGEEARIGGKT